MWINLYFHGWAIFYRPLYCQLIINQPYIYLNFLSYKPLFSTFIFINDNNYIDAAKFIIIITLIFDSFKGIHPAQEHTTSIKENGFKLTKERSRRYPAKTIIDDDYADDRALLANAPAQAEALLHNLERAAAGIGLNINAHKTEYTCFLSNRRYLHTKR